MRRKLKAGVGLVAVTVAALFFLAPVFYWFSEPSAIVYYQEPDILYVYRSLGCAAIGVGTTYYPSNGPQANYSGFHFGCEMVLPHPQYPVG